MMGMCTPVYQDGRRSLITGQADKITIKHAVPNYYSSAIFASLYERDSLSLSPFRETSKTPSGRRQTDTEG